MITYGKAVLDKCEAVRESPLELAIQRLGSTLQKLTVAVDRLGEHLTPVVFQPPEKAENLPAPARCPTSIRVEQVLNCAEEVDKILEKIQRLNRNIQA